MGWYMYKVFIVRKDTKKFIYLLPPCKSKACVWHESAANWKQILMLMSERWYNNGNQSSQVTTPNGSCVPFATCFWASSGLLFLHLLQATNYGPFLEVEMRQNHHELGQYYGPRAHSYCNFHFTNAGANCRKHTTYIPYCILNLWKMAIDPYWMRLVRNKVIQKWLSNETGKQLKVLPYPDVATIFLL
jgi:hypothetical protein